jgi:hypothetical protein
MGSVVNPGFVRVCRLGVLGGKGRPRAGLPLFVLGR